MTSPRFTDAMLTRERAGGIDVETTLQHFAIVTYCVDPEALRRHVDERFDLECITTKGGERRALVSAVPFFDCDFRLVRLRWFKRSFGQTNYRAYVRDRRTGERAVWFFGTSLATLSVLVPRYAWKLPWHHARIAFDCEYSERDKRYTKYRMTTRSRWASAELELEDTGTSPKELDGFKNLEAGLVVLTHPLIGYFYRRDGRLGTYRVWHDRLRMTVARPIRARFTLFDRLGLVGDGDLHSIHSVLLQRSTDFTIYLPPRKVDRRQPR